MFEERETGVAAVSEALDSVTEHELDELEPNVDGEHCTEERLTGACKPRVTVGDELLRVAVTVALPLEESVPAVAVNVVEVEFVGTVTELGTVRFAFPDDRLTRVFETAALDRVTLQLVPVLDVSTDAVH